MFKVKRQGKCGLCRHTTLIGEGGEIMHLGFRQLCPSCGCCNATLEHITDIKQIFPYCTKEYQEREEVYYNRLARCQREGENKC